MRYADTLLTEGEQVVLRSRQHWLALFSRARQGVFLWLVGIALLIVVVWLNIAPGLIRDLLSLGAIVLLVLGLLIFLYRLWQWWAQDYMVTNRRLLKVTGILNKRSADSSLEKINDAILSQSLWGRMLNFGNLEILTAAEQAVDRYYMLNNPKEFKKVMLTQKHNLETEFMYGRPPSPPLRASDAMPHQAPEMQSVQSAPPRVESMAPQPAPAPPAQAPMTAPMSAPSSDPDMTASESAAMSREMADQDESREVTETLSRLADLRDKGAITAEEYDLKKDELLGRL
ncbi:MAG: PH domain-containing protein [Candidatus Limnocylindrales bacterium]